MTIDVIITRLATKKIRFFHFPQQLDRWISEDLFQDDLGIQDYANTYPEYCVTLQGFDQNTDDDDYDDDDASIGLYDEHKKNRVLLCEGLVKILVFTLVCVSPQTPTNT